ncbi:MAG: anhydro-N-acetylmuramic acid kinase [Gammaproteobacteria bacterium]|nr:anhydro-N-acetylmuramic acid kinase [Gammaproteobacteria bacterium]
MTSKPEIPIYAIGLMSGTSADGIDGVVLQIDNNRFSLVATEALPYPETLRQSVCDICSQKIRSRSEAREIEVQLTDLFTAVSKKLLEKTPSASIRVIGCHGQTVHHSPDSSPPFTIQLADGKTIARQTGIPVVTDFRSQDIRAGGQGAPLAPGFHLAAFRSSEEQRAIINIGGISNVTILPKDQGSHVIGFDIGPGNTLMDNWCRRHFSCAFDTDGEIAESGNPQQDLLKILLDEDYFAKPWPKSTGVELFNLNWLDKKLKKWKNNTDINPRDVLASLSTLTAHTICETVNQLEPKIDAVYICGGGALNTGLMKQLDQRCQAKVLNTQALGVGPKWVEAAAFAWMGYQTTQGFASTIPSVTGASQPCIAGVISNP